MLVYGGGTARFERLAVDGSQIDCKLLTDIVDERTRFIKVDTDGFDVPILASSLSFLAERRPCLHFENSVPDLETLNASNKLLEDLRDIGYLYFAVFDDAGLHLVSTTDLETLKSLNHYLFKVLTGPQKRSLFNWDILCLSALDEEIFTVIRDFYR